MFWFLYWAPPDISYDLVASYTLQVVKVSQAQTIIETSHIGFVDEFLRWRNISKKIIKQIKFCSFCCTFLWRQKSLFFALLTEGLVFWKHWTMLKAESQGSFPANIANIKDSSTRYWKRKVRIYRVLQYTRTCTATGSDHFVSVFLERFRNLRDQSLPVEVAVLVKL